MAIFPKEFNWEAYQALYIENNPARWALLFAQRSNDKDKLGNEIGLIRRQKQGNLTSEWELEWRHGVLSAGMKGNETQRRIEQLNAQGRSLVLAIDISSPIDKEEMLKEVERLYEERIKRFVWSVEERKPLKKATVLQWARGLACFDLLESGITQYKIEKYLVPLWSYQKPSGEPEQSHRTQFKRAINAVTPMIEGGWKELAYHPPRTKK